MTLHKLLRQDRIDTGERAAVSTSASAQLRELRRHNRLVEQEVEVLRRVATYLPQAHPTGIGSVRS